MNDRARHQGDLRGDEAGTETRRADLVERAGRRTLYLTSVTLAEILFGIALLPADRRRNTLTRSLDGLLELFGDRVLPFDTDAARHYTALDVAARNADRGFPAPDGYIAAIAASRGFIVASRDTSPYEAGGLRVVDRGKADSATLSAPTS